MVNEKSTQQQMWVVFKAQIGANGYNTFEEFAVAEVARLRAANELYTAALQFYANGIKALIDPCHENANHVAHIAPDDGSLAREALDVLCDTISVTSKPQPRQIVDVRFLPTIIVDTSGDDMHQGHEPDCSYPHLRCSCENPPPDTAPF